MAPDTNPKAKDTLPAAASHDSKNVCKSAVKIQKSI